MPTIDNVLAKNPRYANATEGLWEKVEPSTFAMSITAGQDRVCEVMPRGVREPGAWANEEFANAMLIADAKRNAALAMLVEDLLAACARAEQDYRQLIGVLANRRTRPVSAEHPREHGCGRATCKPSGAGSGGEAMRRRMKVRQFAILFQASSPAIL